MKTLEINYNFSKDDHKILSLLCGESKNIYNFSIFCIQFFNKFKKYIYGDLNIFLKSFFATNIENDKDKIKCIIREEIDKITDKYFKLYLEYKSVYENNNKYIFNFIKNFIISENIEITNKNYYLLRSNIYANVETKINYPNEFKDVFCDNIIDNILDSFYLKNFRRLQNQMIQHLPMDSSDAEFIEQIRNNENIIEKKKVLTKCGILKEYKIDSKNISNQAVITKLIHNNIKSNILTYDLIHEIISKSFQNYSSYYALKKQGKKTNIPKFLKFNDKFNLFFTYRMIYGTTNILELGIGDYIAQNYNTITKNNKMKHINKNLYVNEKYLTKGICSKKDNHIVEDKYINKKSNHIIKANHLYLKNKKILKDVIKQIEIKPIQNGERYKVYIKYEKEREKTNMEHENEKIHSVCEIISIDLGMKNLITIFDPKGEQHIIKGNFINSLNGRYDKLIDIEKSINKNKVTKKMTDLLIQKENKINNYFNIITKWLYKKYGEKKKIIIGYNKEWKKNVNLGAKTNRRFYEIPYRKLLEKIREKFNVEQIDEINESYTSKTDSLAYEEICKHETYSGRRIRRGLFSSSKGKLINADLNGAINIMRKYIKKEKGLYIELWMMLQMRNIYNPKKINVFREVLNKTSG